MQKLLGIYLHLYLAVLSLLIIVLVNSTNAEFMVKRWGKRLKRAATTKPKGCGEALNLVFAMKATILFPPAGGQYPKNLTCHWTYIGNPICIPQITCSIVDLRDSQCSTSSPPQEYLSISDGVGGEVKLCGSNKQFSKPLKATGLGRDLYVTLRTSAVPKYERLFKGVKCDVICGGPRWKEPAPSPTPLPSDKIELKEDLKCVCGVKSNDDDRIVGGKDADVGEFPWQAALVDANSRMPFCGGSVINSKFILTATHCFAFPPRKTKDEFEVLLKAHFLDFQLQQHYDFTAALGKKGSIRGSGWSGTAKTDEEEHSLRFKVDEIIMHPLFSDGYDFDVALIRVNGTIPISGSKGVAPICLVKIADVDNIGLAGTNCTVSGWGLPDQAAGATTRRLQKLNVPIIKFRECTQMYSKHNLSPRMLCAGFKEGMKDSCKGDSGGPLITKLNKYQFAQVGIVSWGEGCARKEQPGVYSRLAELVQWVHYHTRHSGATWCRTSMTQ